MHPARRLHHPPRAGTLHHEAPPAGPHRPPHLGGVHRVAAFPHAPSVSNRSSATVYAALAGMRYGIMPSIIPQWCGPWGLARYVRLLLSGGVGRLARELAARRGFVKAKWLNVLLIAIPLAFAATYLNGPGHYAGT